MENQCESTQSTLNTKYIESIAPPGERCDSHVGDKAAGLEPDSREHGILKKYFRHHLISPHSSQHRCTNAETPARGFSLSGRKERR